jgi:hypothetical protein
MEEGLEGEAPVPRLGLLHCEGEEQPGRLELILTLPADLIRMEPRFTRPPKIELAMTW